MLEFSRATGLALLIVLVYSLQNEARYVSFPNPWMERIIKKAFVNFVRYPCVSFF